MYPTPAKNLIDILTTAVKDDGWVFDVQVDGRRYEVTLDRDYWQHLVGKGEASAEEVIIQTFNFLLGKEPKSAIQTMFNVRIVADYFPDFEKTIQEYAETKDIKNPG